MLLMAPVFRPRTGGVPTLYHHLCLNMAPGSVVVLAPRAPGAEVFDRAVPYPVRRRARFVEIGAGALPGVILEAWAVNRLAKAEGVTHLCFGHVNQCLTALLLMPWWRARMSLYAHGEEIAADMGGRLLPPLKNRFLRRVRRVIAVSRNTVRLLEERGVDPAAIRVIPNGVELKHFTPGEKDPELVGRWGLQGRTVLLTLARLERRKGHDTVIRALPEVLRAVPDAHYLIGGEGEERARLEALVAETGVADRVTFLGAVAEADLCRVYNLADVFVMPNRELDNGDTEGFGIVFLEAGACAKPVIGGRAGGVPDAVADGETGLLVDGNDPDAFAVAAVRLLTDPALRKDMGAAGRRLAETHTYARVAQAVTEFLA
jgi:phosphatidylinositol alpha-1,6-mannosyltransferase